jgi:hypothetical protein
MTTVRKRLICNADAHSWLIGLCMLIVYITLASPHILDGG